jgi:FkbM family methyltransferase
MTLAYKKYLEDVLIIKNGYLTNADNPHDSTFHNKTFSCEEANTIIKINYNENNYFDFNKAILDIGAFVGVYSFMTPFKFAYCFEPNFESYSLLNVNMMHHDKKFKSYNVLLSDKQEIIKFDGFNTENKYSNKCVGPDGEHFGDAFNDEISTEMLAHTIDEYDCKNVGFIKIDVEGMEEKVLRGAINTIKNNNYPPILFELFEVGDYMPQEKFDSFVNFITIELGYEIIWYYGDSRTHLAVHK